MEEKIFLRPAVAAELNNFIEARLHTDGTHNLEAIKALQKKLTGSVANPIYVIVDSKTGEKLRVKAGFMTEDNFIAFLKG